VSITSLIILLEWFQVRYFNPPAEASTAAEP
jgi:hypothetical protein